MSTTAQIIANQQNSAHSTGPRSDAGKATVSRNAVSHGLSSGSPVLACEDRSGFDRLLQNLHSDFSPQDEHDRFLVRQMAEARWRLARIRRLETAALDLMLGMADPESPDTRLAEALLNRGGDIQSKLERYAAAAERSYFKAHQELLKSAKSRKQEQTAKTPKLTDKAVLNLLFGMPDYETKPNSSEPDLDGVDEDELEALTRPATAFPNLS
jgi:hypothetical protein